MTGQDKRSRAGTVLTSPKQPSTARALRQRAEAVFLKNTAQSRENPN